MRKVKILVVVDMQNDFVTGSLGSIQAQEIVPNVMDKINNYDGEYIIFTRDTHTDDYLFSKEGQKLPVKHCIKGSDGWRLIPEIEDYLKKNLMSREKTVMVVDKPTFGSVYHDNETKSLIDCVNDIKTANEKCEFYIEVIGVCTGICVVSNALLLKAYFYDIADITVDAKCCACVSDKTHDAALTTMETCQINVINRL